MAPSQSAFMQSEPDNSVHKMNILLAQLENLAKAEEETINRHYITNAINELNQWYKIGRDKELHDTKPTNGSTSSPQDPYAGLIEHGPKIINKLRDDLNIPRSNHSFGDEPGGYLFNNLLEGISKLLNAIEKCIPNKYQQLNNIDNNINNIQEKLEKIQKYESNKMMDTSDLEADIKQLRAITIEDTDKKKYLDDTCDDISRMINRCKRRNNPEELQNEGHILLTNLKNNLNSSVHDQNINKTLDEIEKNPGFLKVVGTPIQIANIVINAMHKHIDLLGGALQKGFSQFKQQFTEFKNGGKKSENIENVDAKLSEIENTFKP